MPTKILVILGSLRKASYNGYLIEAARECFGDRAELRRFDLGGIPPFNQDHEREPPETVRALKQSVRDCDALLVATPEYNYSVPGVLKNAIDWATRPYGDNPFKDKPGAIMGATTGGMGTSRAQSHLRQILAALNVHLLCQPEVTVAGAEERFDAQGRLTCDKTRAQVQKLADALLVWTQRLRD